MKRRLLIIFTLGAIGAAVALAVNPVNSSLLKLSFIGSLLLSWVGVLAITWKLKWLRGSLVVFPLILAAPFLLPSKVIVQ